MDHSPAHPIVPHAHDEPPWETTRMPMAEKIKKWTLRELHSLPDDGNKYELVRGELFVTPPPSDDHETILARLSRWLDPYVATNGLGLVYRPRSVIRFQGSEVEPDLMVREPRPGTGNEWERAPIPILVVEVLSGTTRRRDLLQKRDLYMDAGVAEYWIIDPEQREIRVVRPGATDVVASDTLEWRPAGTAAALTIAVRELFGDTIRSN